jgi:hypothetical protein
MLFRTQIGRRPAHPHADESEGALHIVIERLLAEFLTESVTRGRSLYCSIRMRRDTFGSFTPTIIHLLAGSLAYK